MELKERESGTLVGPLMTGGDLSRKFKSYISNLTKGNEIL
jgi:hypothetical protein